MPRLDIRTRERVVLLKKNGFTYKEIKERLKEEGIETTIKSLYLLVAKFNNTNSVVDRPRLSRPKLLNREHYEFIDNALASNDELTSQNLRDLLVADFPELRISLNTVKRARHQLGWVVSNPKYCQLIRDINKEKRMKWCNEMIKNEEQFDDVIFTDESSVMLERHRRRCYRKKGSPRKLKPHPKHPVKLHIWGGISKRGATSVVVFTGIMTATR